MAVRQARVRTFLAQRTTRDGSSPALALLQVQKQQAALLTRQKVRAHGGSTSPLDAAWQPLGPSSIVSPLYGKLTGRVTAIALDPNDLTGNTAYIGTTGGGVWKSTNAAGPLSSVTFKPLTDTLPVFSADAGSGTIPSLSIGAVAVQPVPNPVVLAGTGDPNDATDSLYGEGLLRSADGGLTWTLVTDSHDGATGNHSLTGLATAGLAWSTATPTLVVAALSTSPESAIVNAAGSSSVPGLYYSTDAGVTWQMSTIYDGGTVVQQPAALGTAQSRNPATSVVWDAQRNLFFAALRGHGYYSSSDGAGWTRLANQPGTGLTTANCPVGANGDGSSTCPIFRGTLAVQPANGDLYALTIDGNDNDQGLWQDLCNAGPGGSCASPSPTWGARIDNGALEVGSGSAEIVQGNYNLSLAASPAPSGGTLLFAGTVDLYRCSLASGASSCMLRDTTNALNGCKAPAGVAPAQHAIVATETSGAQFVLLGNDGGLWRSTDGVAETGPPCSASDAQHFDNLNGAIGAGGSLAEITGFAQDPGSAGTLLAGLGENGSAATTTATALAAWPQLAAGEGGYPQIDPNTPTNWFLAIGAGVNLTECALGSACSASDFIPPATIGEPQVSNDAALLDAPTLLDPQETDNVLTGTCRVWRGPAASGSAWSAGNALSPAFDGSGTPCSASSALVRSLAAGGPQVSSGNAQNSGSTVLYAGMAGLLDGGGSIPGHLFVTTTANTDSSATSWTDVTGSPVAHDPADAGVFNPGAFDISSIATDPHDPTGATVYATVMGYGNLTHLYRSTDFGAHWTSVNSNLPEAPANAVVIDPNDANTVYVALDSGVYVTQVIASCATVTTCWSPLGIGLPNAPVTALEAAPKLPTGDGRQGMLRAGTYGRGMWQIPLLTATGIVQPAITLSATTLGFGAQPVASESDAQTITVTSSGSAPVVFATPSISGDFVENDTCSGQTLAVGNTCSFDIRFAPTQTGTRSGLLTIYASISGGQATVNLTGSATAPAAIVLTPLTLTFPATVVNQSAAAQIITVANTGANPATLNAPTITGDFTIAANTCGATLAADTACSISISFTPTASGARTGVLTITDSAGTQTAQLSGTGNSPATDTLGPLALSFPQQSIGTASAAQQVTLTNAGDVSLTLITAAVSAGDFTATNACGASLNPHASCAISVAFVPTAAGTRTAALTVTDQFRSQTVSLSGIGIAPAGVSLSPSSLTFPATGVSLTALPQTLTLTNNGGLPLDITNAAVSMGFLIASTTCGATLAPAANCNFVIVFAPTAAGVIPGTLTLSDNAPSGAQTANLSGTGIDFALSTNGATTATVASGSSATYPLLLSSLSSLSGAVALACSGAPTNSVCTVAPATSNLGVTKTLSVTVQTGQSTQTARLLRPRVPGNSSRAPALLALLALPLIFALRRRTLVRLLPLLLLGTFLGLSGCGSSRTIPGGGGGGGGGGGSATPSGTYTLVVNASAAGLTHSVNLTLTVQ
ncbi:MAG TPA: choice-of-anchor D domain-containing protein [Acidobacteriaceae bacterium]